MSVGEIIFWATASYPASAVLKSELAGYTRQNEASYQAFPLASNGNAYHIC